ncbi:MAG: 2-C-methyl-D-erythritol 4-phosphate cytidylyltransferase [Acutalibacteraceae bacterium]|nr:2-C-methyl-D-erythritol 4-phosphate cytidylyltransferase [Acutalibacteraceae bacterium]
MEAKITASAIIVAAGSSTRMGKPVSKQLIKLNGTEVIVHTLKAFEASEAIDEIILVCREQDTEIIKALAESNGITKPLKLTKGGVTRQESVKNGVMLVKYNAEYIAIHDGARPLISPCDINSVVNNATRYKSSALGVPVKDTIKVIDENGIITATPERSSLIAIYTPQVFNLELYKNAMEKAKQDGKDYTDDCQLVEALGESVYVTIGSPTNIKLTTPEDIIIAESFLKEREN